MSDWKAKRFWTSTSVVESEKGFGVTLDERPVRTPAKAPLVVPTKSLAEAIAAEWDAQDKIINPLSMPFTRSANAAIDKVAVMRAEVIEELAGFGGTDLLCYRAEAPEELRRRQADAWDPWLTWSANALDAPLVAGKGVMHIEQPERSLERLANHVAEFDDFQLTGLHDLVALSGSLVLALAIARDRLAPARAWDLSRIDEDWQISQWGEDEEAAALAAQKFAAFEHAARFFRMSLR